MRVPGAGRVGPALTVRSPRGSLHRVVTPSALDPRLVDVARRLIWWESPEDALRRPSRFVAQAMTLGTWSDVEVIRAVYGETAMRAVLADPPPGVFDRRSWVYWHVRFGIDPVPPLPSRFP